jgi:hypothetical protein
MIAIIITIALVVIIMIVGFVLNLYLYFRRALSVTPDDPAPKSAAEQQRDLDNALFW